MPVFLRKLLAPLPSKIAKNEQFVLCFVNLIAEVRIEKTIIYQNVLLV